MNVPALRMAMAILGVVVFLLAAWFVSTDRMALAAAMFALNFTLLFVSWSVGKRG